MPFSTNNTVAFYSEAVFKCRRYLWRSVILWDEEDGVLALQRELGAEVAPRLLTPAQILYFP
jgi:hypothetical protein